MNNMHTIQPHITVLSQEQVYQVHAYSLDILSTVGVRVDSEQARRIFAQAGSPADDGDGTRIKWSKNEQRKHNSTSHHRLEPGASEVGA